MFKNLLVFLILLAVQFCCIAADYSKTFIYNERDQLVSIERSDDPGNLVTFDYDASGNRISKTQNGVVTEYKWSPRGDLAEVSRNGVWLARYQYNSNGLRIVKQIRPIGKNVQEFRYVYDGNRLVSETNAIGNTLVRYHWIENRPMGETRNGENYYYMLDGMDSIVAITRQDGSIAARFEYDAFGNITGTQGSHVGIFGFTGYYADDETGLYYAQQRYYDSELGAFISEDPLEGVVNDPPTNHRYLYARANPTKFVDKDGRCSWVIELEDPYECDRMKKVFTDEKIRAEVIQEAYYGAAAVEGVAQAIGDAVVGTIHTIGDVGGAYIEAFSGGKYAQGSMLRLRGQVDATLEFVQHPIDTTKRAIDAHNEKVNELLAAGDIEGAIKERTRFGFTGLLSVGGGGAAGVVVKNKVYKTKPDQPPEFDVPEVDPPFNDVTGIVMEGGGNNVQVARLENPQVKVNNDFVFLNSSGMFYPRIRDLRTDRPIIFPTGELNRVPKADRVQWTAKDRGNYIKEWYDRGYETPEGGWAQYDVHHIKPREFGGDNDFWNLTPIQRKTHQQEFNAFWRDY